MTIEIDWNDLSMKLAAHGVAGGLQRKVAFALENAILEVRECHKFAKEGDAQAQKIGLHTSQARESPNQPWVNFVHEKTYPYKATKIKLVEEKLMELLGFVLDWDKEKLDD